MSKMTDFRDGRIIPIDIIYTKDIEDLLEAIKLIQSKVFIIKETIIHTDIIISMSGALNKAQKELERTKKSDLLYKGKFG